MTDFLIKSTLTMAALLGLYYILFEREKMHRFNRFYLLSALVFSFVLPFITVITYITVIETPVMAALGTPGVVAVVSEQPVDYMPYIGCGLYSIVTVVMLIRFIRNISHFIKKATHNTTVIIGSAKLVLLEEKILPHTFLNYIFVNREEYEAKKIEEELYTHEYTHLRQRHTLDILFIEALKTIFWFNPLLYFYKKAIQLNHEFLADEKVINTTANTIYYQNLLLEKATVGKTFSMASNLTFSLTKKRFLMMTKTTSTVKASLLKLTILPAVTGLMMLFCTETVAQTKKENEPKVNRIEVNTITKREFKALQKADPVKYTGKSTEYLKTTISYGDKKNETVTYNRKPSESELNNNQTFSEFSKLDVNSITSIEVLQLTETEKADLKKQDPEKYNDEALKDYLAIKGTYKDDKGELHVLTAYEKKPAQY